MEKYATRLSIALSVLTLLGILFTGSFWFFKTNELPQQVNNHEERISQLEKQMVENNTKTELIYQAILEIRRAVVYDK